MNLLEGLKKELNRNREILKMYEEIPEGAFGATMIKQSIERAERAITDGDTISMIQAYKELENTK